MNDHQYSAFLILIRAIDSTMSYAKFKVHIQLSSLDDLKRACSECISKGLDFKVHSNHSITIYRGDGL